MKTEEVPSFRVWRSADSVVPDRFLEPCVELHLDRAAEPGVPVLKRHSGGGAVFHDPGNVNHSIYIPAGRAPGLDTERSLKAPSFQVDGRPLR